MAVTEQLFVASGPWTNWEHSINDPKNGDIITWATKKEDVGGFYEKLNPGDTVFMANQPPPNNGPYSKKVIFGFGDVIKKYRETKKYWPDAGEWVNRFDIQPTFVAETDENALRWSTNLAPYGLRSIPDSNKFKKKLIEWKKKHSTNMEHSTFKFVRKDFGCKKEENDAKYRRGRFVELFDDMIPKLGPRFDEVKKDVGLSIQSRKRKLSYFGRHNKRGEKKYFDYTWLGIYIAQPPPNPTSTKTDFKYSAKDTVQFQVGLNPRDPIWAGLYIGRLPGVEQTRKRMLTLLKEQPKECLRMFKSLAEEYVIKIYGPVKKDDSSRLEGTWEIPKLDEDSLNEILEKYSKKGTDFRICKFFTRKEALK